MTGVDPRVGKIHAWVDSDSEPSTVAPSNRPPNTSPMARGWRKRTNRDPIPWAHRRIAARAISVWARSAVGRVLMVRKGDPAEDTAITGRCRQGCHGPRARRPVSTHRPHSRQLAYRPIYAAAWVVVC